MVKTVDIARFGTKIHVMIADQTTGLFVNHWKQNQAIRRAFSIFCLSPLFLLVTACESSSESAAAAGALAQQQFDAEQYFEARATIVEAIAERDDIANLHLMRGRIELALQNRMDAFRAYSDALSLEPSNPEALQAVSQLGLQMGYFRESERAADSILSFAPNHTNALLAKGLIALLKRRYTPALEIADKVIASNPDDEGGTILKARIMAISGERDEALQLVEDTVAETGYTQGMTLTLLELYREAQYLPKLLDTFERLEKMSPENPDLKVDYANTLYKSGDKAGARKLLMSLLRDNPTAQNAIGTATSLWLEYDEAPLTTEDIAFLAKDGSIEARVVIARYFLAERKPKLAAQILESVSSGYWVEAQALYARALYNDGRINQAMPIVTQILENDETNADALLVHSSYEIDQSQYARAINDAQIVVQNYPRLEDGYLALAGAYMAKGDSTGAKRVFEDAMKRLPQSSRLIEEFSAFLIRNDDVRRAISATRTFTRFSPALITGWQLRARTCSEIGFEPCVTESRAGEKRAATIYGIDLPPGAPPTRGLFGRLN